MWPICTRLKKEDLLQLDKFAEKKAAKIIGFD